MQGADGAVIVEAPGEYPFHVYDKPSQRSGGIMKNVMLVYYEGLCYDHL